MWLHDRIINQDPIAVQVKGGPGSGNWGHAGRKGQRGGSVPKSGMGAAMSLATGRNWETRQFQAKENSVLDTMSSGAVADYQLAVKKYGMNREQRWKTLQAWKGVKNAHKYDGSYPAGDSSAMQEAVYYVGPHGSLEGAKQHYSDKWGEANTQNDSQKAGTALGHIERIEAIQGKRPAIYKPPESKEQIHKIGKLKKPATEAKNAMAAPKVSDDYYIARVEGLMQGGKVSGTTWEKVKGKPITIPGFEDHDLFIHRPAGSKKGYQISEGRTGSALGYAGATQKETIQNLQIRLQKQNSAAFKDNIQRFIQGTVERSGFVPLSPRYEGGLQGTVIGGKP